MGDDLRQQLLKAGLAKKSDVARIAREQARQRHARPAKTAAAASPDVSAVDARRLQSERAERDRQLSAERNALVRAQEAQAQVRQIVESARVPGAGDIAYAFQDGPAIRRLAVDLAQRSLLAKGMLVVVRHDGGHALLPRAAADKVAARDPSAIVVDHARTASAPAEPDPDYAAFPVPDDLVW